MAEGPSSPLGSRSASGSSGAALTVLSQYVSGARQGKTECRTERRISLALVEWNPKSWAMTEGCGYSLSLRIDGEPVARTRSLSDQRPFWNEQFAFKIPEDFELLTVYVHEESRSTDVVLGKAVISKDAVAAEPYYDRWLSIEAIQGKVDITGKVNIDAEIIPDPEGNLMVKVFVVEAAAINATNVYAIITAEKNAVSGEHRHRPVEALRNPKEIKRTKTFKRKKDPVWTESFAFQLPRPESVDDDDGNIVWRRGESPNLRISLWSEVNESGTDDIFLGYFLVPLGSAHHKTQRTQRLKEEEAAQYRNGSLGFPLSEWFMLLPNNDEPPRESDTPEAPPRDTNLGSLRVKIELSEYTILPIAEYQPLTNVLLAALDEPLTSVTVIEKLDVSQRSKERLANDLINFYSEHGKAYEFLCRVLARDIEECADPATLFRSNSLGTKALDFYMKVLGTKMLHFSLGPTVGKVLANDMALEINPSTITDEKQLEANRTELESLVHDMLADVLTSFVVCPHDLRRVFQFIADTAGAKFADTPSVRRTAVSGFIFLRFYAAAILSPQLFGLCHTQPSAVVKRTLTLMSKSVQSVANLGREQNAKEEYMRTLLETLLEKHRERLEVYLDLISIPPETTKQADIDALDWKTGEVILKEGMVIKRGLGRKKALMGMTLNGLKNMKNRYFSLTSDGLSYYRAKGEPLLDKFEKTDILGAEQVDPQALNSAFAFQVLLRDNVLYLVANSAMDMEEWISAIRELSATNKDLLAFYHPGIYINGAWTCCKATKVQTESGGCRPCTRGLSEKYPKLRGQQPFDYGSTLERLYKTTLDMLDNPHDYGHAHTPVKHSRNTSNVSISDFDSSGTSSPGAAESLMLEAMVDLEKVDKAVRSIEAKHAVLSAPAARRGSKYRPYAAQRPRSSMSM